MRQVPTRCAYRSTACVSVAPAACNTSRALAIPAAIIRRSLSWSENVERGTGSTNWSRTSLSSSARFSASGRISPRTPSEARRM